MRKTLKGQLFKVLYSSKIKFKPRQLYLQPQNSVLSSLRLAS